MSDIIYPCKIMNDLKIHGIYRPRKERKNPQGVKFEGFFDVSKTTIGVLWRNPIDLDFTGVKIVIKVGSAPIDGEDGLIILNHGVGDVISISTTNIDGYENAIRGASIADLEADTTYYISIYPCDSHGVIKNSPNVVQVNTKTWRNATIYGFAIDETIASASNAVTYIDDAEGFTGASCSSDGTTFTDEGWLNRFPFNQIRVVTLNESGNVVGEVNPTDYTTYTDGTAIDTTLDVMVEIPTVWWFAEKTGDVLKVHISDTKINDNFKALAHTDKNNVVKEKLYVSAYFSVLVDGKYYSISGQMAHTGNSYLTVKPYATTKGEGWGLLNYQAFSLIQILYLLMTKTRDSQTSIGRGITSSSSTYNYPNGHADANGMYYGQGNSYQSVKFMGIENLWGHNGYYLDGVTLERDTLIITYTMRNDVTKFSYQGRKISDSYLCKVKGTTEFLFMVDEVSDDYTSSTGYCDEAGIGVYVSDSARKVLVQNGYAGYGTLSVGIFTLQVYSDSNGNSRRSARLEYL